MSIRDDVTQSLESLSEPELQQVADYVAFLKLRAGLQGVSLGDPAQLAAAYAEAAEEDRSLAEAGMADYHEGLRNEDSP